MPYQKGEMEMQQISHPYPLLRFLLLLLLLRSSSSLYHHHLLHPCQRLLLRFQKCSALAQTFSRCVVVVDIDKVGGG
jgi:hypothetical protein